MVIREVYICSTQYIHTGHRFTISCSNISEILGAYFYEDMLYMSVLEETTSDFVIRNFYVAPAATLLPIADNPYRFIGKIMTQQPSWWPAGSTFFPKNYYVFEVLL